MMSGNPKDEFFLPVNSHNSPSWWGIYLRSCRHAVFHSRGNARCLDRRKSGSAVDERPRYTDFGKNPISGNESGVWFRRHSYKRLDMKNGIISERRA